jgi:class 3 adenylate cyclase
MAAVVACGSCGTVLREDANFCDECGGSTAVSAETANYKQVTVLFADVVHSMDLAAALDVERLREIMTELLERAAALARRYGGTVEYNGDGVMAIFGAPVTLEDHAFRACLTAMAVQEDVARLAAEVKRRDGATLQLRVGLNSGRVIAGRFGSGSFGYRAIGEHVGIGQRIESAAPPGEVLVSDSTARLVSDHVTLAEPEWVQIKGVDEPVRAHRLLAIGPRDAKVGRTDATLVGRRWEMAALEAMLNRASAGDGCVVNVVGPAGIGKSRAARETATLAAARGVDVCWAFCESHAQDVPFHAVARLLRAGMGVTGLEGEAARAEVREQISNADPQDLLLLDDLLGIADPEIPLPQIDPDARRRRLTALINTASLERTTSALFILEDAHWIDAISESLLADLLIIIKRTPSMVLITSRPEYAGALTRIPGAQAIALAPLADSDTTALIGELMGTDPSVDELSAIIAERAAGNPFFAEEIVLELVQRGVLEGERGKYVCRVDAAEVGVPATVQAAIEARIDRLTTAAKQTLNAAAVIGSRFEADLLATLKIDAAFDELLSAELIDQVRFTPSAEYAFHHPLIRTVAYESQLKSDRAEWHRRVAAAIQERDPAAVEENAALIARHLEAAHEMHAAYAWHMRAGTWATNRDIAAARPSWELARKIAEALPADAPDLAAMRIAPLTMLCATAWRVHVSVTGGRFDELRKLCAGAGNKGSLAIGMAGLVIDHAYHDRIRDASALATEQMALTEAIGDPNLIIGLCVPVMYAKLESAEISHLLRWSQRVIDLADGDPSKGDFIFGSPLAYALTSRAIARYFLGRPGWRDDLRHGLAMGRSVDPLSYAAAVSLSYFAGIPCGVLRPEDSVLSEINYALQIAERSGDDLAVANVRMALSVALASRDTVAERDRGQKLLADVADVFVRGGHNLAELPILRIYLAREKTRRGEPDEAISIMRAAVDHVFREVRLLLWGPAATGLLVQALLDRGADGDVTEAQAAVDRLAAAPADDELVIRDIWLLQSQSLLARARGDDAAYRESVGRYLAMAESLGFEGHIDSAKAMINGE